MTTTVFHMTDKERKKFPMSFVTAKGIMVNKDSHKLVGTVETDDLELAYMLTNHIDCDWMTNALVIPHVNKARSSSVGDMFINDDGVFIADGCGFIPAEYEKETI